MVQTFNDPSRLRVSRLGRAMQRINAPTCSNQRRVVVAVENLQAGIRTQYAFERSDGGLCSFVHYWFRPDHLSTEIIE